MRLKAIVSLFIFFFGSLHIVSAQEEEPSTQRSKFTFGTELGIVLGTPYQKPEEGAKGNLGIGPNLGIFARYRIIDKLSVQTGLTYVVKKAKYDTPAVDRYYKDDVAAKDSDGNPLIINGEPIIFDIETFFNGTVEGSFNNKYIENPILVIYDLGSRWSLHTGFYTSYLLSGEHKGKATGVVGDNFLTLDKEEFDESSDINTWDYGLNLGANYKVFKQLECELRLTSALRSVFQDDYQAADGIVRNMYLQAKVNYTFQL